MVSCHLAHSMGDHDSYETTILEWTGVDVLMSMAAIISRASNRVFVGVPLCECYDPRGFRLLTVSSGRNEDYLRIVRQFTFDVSRARHFMSWFPKPLKRVVGPLLPWARRASRQASVYLRPMIEDRQEKQKELGEGWTDKPVSYHSHTARLVADLPRVDQNDYLMWVMDEANRQGEPIEVIVDAVMASNFAAIHTSSNVRRSGLTSLCVGQG